MRRGSIFVILFIVVAAVVIGASQFLRSQPPAEMVIAVDPLAVAWVENAVTGLNATNPVVNATQRVQFRVTPVDDLDVWQGQRIWTPDNHPVAWIPASTISVGYARENGVPVVDLTPSVARTPLVWGGYVSRINVITNDGAEVLDWPTVEAAAEEESWQALGGERSWGFIKLGFAQPSRKMSGLGVLFSGAGAFHQKTDLTGADLRAAEFRDWMLPVIQSVPNFSTLGSDPAAAMARGPSTVEIGIFPESQWLLNLSGLLQNEDVVLNYPAYQFVLNFPLVRWQDSSTTDEQRQAVDLLNGWLLSATQQANAPDHGLRPAALEPAEDDALFAAGVPYGIQLAPDFGQTVTVPGRSDAQGFIQWVSSNQ
jgi:hypothetical protein